MPSPLLKPTDDKWVRRWSRVAELTANLEPDDRRMPAIRRILDECDAAYRTRNDERFIQAGKHLRVLIENGVPRKGQENISETRPVEELRKASQNTGTASKR